MLGAMGKHLPESVEDAEHPPIWRTKTALSAVLMLTVIILTILGFRWLTTDHEATPDSTFTVENTEPEVFDSPSDAPAPTDEQTSQLLVVHVAGEVQDPGIVELEQSARVIDAIDGAGGPTTDAQLDGLNLAALVNDGEYILVPDRQSSGQVMPTPSTAHGTAPATNTATVNINTADTAELETLPGVGPATADKIISHREQHGTFTQLADLEAVSGIGPATLERLDGLVSW